MTTHSDAVVGKTIERVEYDYDEALRLHFTDGTMLYISGVWHNDSTAGTGVALIAAEQPKTYEESKGFYEFVYEQRWDQ